MQLTAQYTTDMNLYLRLTLQLLVKRSKYGEDPAVYKEKLEAIEAKILAKNKLLEESVKFAGVCCIKLKGNKKKMK